MVLTKVKKVKDIRMPWLDIDGEGTRTLVAALVDITSSSVVSTEHGHDAIGVTVSSGNVRSVRGMSSRRLDQCSTHPVARMQ